MVRSVEAQRLHADLHLQISSRNLKPGMTIPSENELAANYGISRPTVRKVIGQLCAQGLLERRMGKGTFVSEQPTGKAQQPDHPFKLGTDSINAGRFYYSDIFTCISSLPYGKNIYLNILDNEESARGVVPEHLDALLLACEMLPPEAYSCFARRNLPVAHINRKCDFAQVSYVTIDHFFEAERAVSLYLKAGYHRVMLVGALNDNFYQATSQRTAGWAAAYRKKFGEVPLHLQLPYKFIPDADFIQRLESLKPDAYFFVNFAQYEHFLLSYAQCTGKSAANFNALIFDDVDSKTINHYPQTNFIRMPIARMTEMCLAYLWKKTQIPATPLLRETLPCDLVLRTEI